MARLYDGFVQDPGVIPDEGVVDIAIRELTPDDRRRKYFTRYVRVKICADPKKMPDGDDLELRGLLGILHEKRWKMKVVKELGAYLPKKVIYLT